LIHLKSLTLGKTTLTSLSIKLYILSHLNVTLSPTGIHALNLKLEIAFLAYLTVGACPNSYIAKSFKEEKSLLPVLIYVQIHIFNTTFSSLGTSMMFLISKLFCNAGTISLLYFSLRDILYYFTQINCIILLLHLLLFF